MATTGVAKYMAIGSGEGYALGALYALYGQDITAYALAQAGVKAAMAFGINCGGDVALYPVVVEKRPSNRSGGLSE